MSQNIPGPIQPPSLPRERSSRTLLVLIIVAVLLIPPTALVIWYTSIRASNASAIRKLENEARQRGEPLTLDDLAAKYPPIPEEENAAAALIEIWTAEDRPFWEAFLKDERPLPKHHTEQRNPALPFLSLDPRRIPRVGPLDSNSLAAATVYLDEKASHLEKVSAAIRRSRFRFPVKFEAGPNALLPHLSLLKSEALDFRLVALMAAERGDMDAAISALNNTTRIGQLLADEPVLISQLVRVSCLAMSVDEIERVLSRQSPTADQLKKLLGLLEESNLHGVARIALIDERADILCLFDPDILARAAESTTSSDDEDSPERKAYKVRAGSTLFQMIGFWDFDRRLILETFRDAIALAGEETPESLVKYDELFDAAEIKARKFPPKLFSRMLLPGLQRIPQRYASYEARRRAAVCAVAIEGYRRDHAGQIPEKLDSLIPNYLTAVPYDTFNGNFLRFRKMDQGYVLYSIGPDREDNEGKEYLRGSREHTDVTFTVER